MTLPITRLIFLLALVSTSGCFSLARDEPVRHHFVLGGHQEPESPGSQEPLTGLRIGLRQLQMADYLNSPLIVVRQGSNRLHYSEFNRWGGELTSGVKRAVSSYLSALAPFDGVDSAPWDSRATHDYLIQVHLLRLEGLVTEDRVGTEGQAHMLASWEVIHPLEGTVLARGTTDYKVDGWMVDDYASLVDRLDAGLWQLSRDLIEALGKLEGPG